MPPRGQTAYFLFSEEHRAAAKADLAAQDGAKAGVAQVAKLVGAKWAALSDEEKQQYKDRAAAKTRQMKGVSARHQCRAAGAASLRQWLPTTYLKQATQNISRLSTRAEEAAAAAAAQGQQQQSPGGEGAAAGEEPAPAAVGGGGAAPPPFGFPTGVVKRIMMVDDEVQRVSADAVRAIAKATELFVQQLAARALQHAQAGKRKNFKEPDVAHVAGRDRCAQSGGTNAQHPPARGSCAGRNWHRQLAQAAQAAVMHPFCCLNRGHQ